MASPAPDPSRTDDFVLVDPAGTSVEDGVVRYHWPAVDATAGLVAMRVPYDVELRAPYVRNGWQSWSAPTLERFGGHRSRASVTDDLRTGRRRRFERAQWDGDESYDILVGGGRVAMVLEHGALLVARPRRRDLLVIVEAPGPYPDLHVADDDAHATVRALLRRARGRVPGALPNGWCSWYGCYEHVTEDEIASTLRGVGAVHPSIDVVQVDDGWQAAIGVWDRTSAAFPRGRRALAGEIADAGYRAGLWFAPFVVPRDFARPDWLLRDAAGAPVGVIDVPHWGGEMFALDVTRPDVLAWATDLAASAVADGFTYLKFDFLYAAALAGARTAPVSGHSAFRTAVEALRAGAGDEAFIVACGSPLWPAIGIVDAMRVGPDVAPHWTPGRAGRVDRQAVSCLENTWRSARLRSQFHGVLWANDPDCVMLRRRNTALTRSERMGWAHWVADSGQLFMVSDAPADLDARDFDTWSALLARRTASAPVVT